MRVTQIFRESQGKRFSLIGATTLVLLLAMAVVIVERHSLAIELANLGSVAFNHNRYRQAELYYRAALFLDSSLIQARSQFADAILQQGANEKAIEELNLVLEIQPDYGPARSYRGRALQRLGQYHAANEDFKTAFLWFAQFAEDEESAQNAAKEYAHGLEKEGLLSESEAIYSTIISDIGTNARAEDFRNRAVLRLKLFRFKEALSDIEVAEGIGPEPENDLDELRFLALEGMRAVSR